ncbi:MAG: SIS domain-containing protein [Limnochordaceae bacterium]|nr:SIS domain-containing protein [Limnochordaceae bacterium]
MLAQQYLLEVEKVMRHIRETQLSAVLQVAPKIVEHMGDTGTLFVFGASHSSMIAQEVYYRAGGLATVKALLRPG